MADQLAYAIITPYSLKKSRTGGIISRLVARSGLSLAGARMYAPSLEFAQEYAKILQMSNHSSSEYVSELSAEYVLKNFPPNPATGKKNRVMVLLFQGEDAVCKIRQVVGELSTDRYGGETISGTYGDLVCDACTPEKPVYFEPGVLVASTEEGAALGIRLLSRHYADSGVLTKVERYPAGIKPQITLAMIKPDNFKFPMGRPGNVIDFFSQTGLSIVGIKVQRMSTGQAVEFYGPVLEVLRTKLGGRVAGIVKPAIEKALGSAVDEETAQKIGNLLCPIYGEKQFDNIVRFMSGRSRSECSPSEMNKPGTEESLVLIYEGPDAIAKIRKALGPTDPSKAPPGSIRREFGSNVMVNAAHASDSEESVKREMDILIYKTPNDFKELCDRFYPV